MLVLLYIRIVAFYVRHQRREEHVVVIDDDDDDGDGAFG